GVGGAGGPPARPPPPAGGAGGAPHPAGTPEGRRDAGPRDPPRRAVVNKEEADATACRLVVVFLPSGWGAAALVSRAGGAYTRGKILPRTGWPLPDTGRGKEVPDGRALDDRRRAGAHGDGSDGQADGPRLRGPRGIGPGRHGRRLQGPAGEF